MTCRARGGRIVAVGTTSLRLLESAAGDDGAIAAWSGETSIFITPGYRFKAVDVLMTNFHLPRSTLFMLVAAFSRSRHDARRLWACHSRRLPLLFLRRRLPAVPSGGRSAWIAPQGYMAETFDFRVSRPTARRDAAKSRRRAASFARRPSCRSAPSAPSRRFIPEQVRDAGADIMLGNTYHLMLRPGAERVAKLGGLHKFMGWDGPILTDSGGFQVMSLAKIRKITEEGVTFQSHIDGSRHMLTPERSIEIQCLLGADIQMQFDECIELPAAASEVERAMQLSLRWAERSKRAFEAQRASGGVGPGQALFGIVQGGTDVALRQRSAEALVAMDFPGLCHRRPRGRRGHEAMIATLAETLPASARRQAALPDGRRHAGRSHRIRSPRRRHVRLRDADAQRPPRPCVHLGRRAQHAQRPACRRSVAARRAEFVPGRAAVFARLSAPPDQVGRIPRGDDPVVGQHGVLSGPDGGDARGDLCRQLRRVGGGNEGSHHKAACCSRAVARSAAPATRSRCTR